MRRFCAVQSFQKAISTHAREAVSISYYLNPGQPAHPSVPVLHLHQDSFWPGNLGQLDIAFERDRSEREAVTTGEGKVAGRGVPDRLRWVRCSLAQLIGSATLPSSC